MRSSKPSKRLQSFIKNQAIGAENSIQKQLSQLAISNKNSVLNVQPKTQKSVPSQGSNILHSPMRLPNQNSINNNPQQSPGNFDHNFQDKNNSSTLNFTKGENGLLQTQNTPQQNNFGCQVASQVNAFFENQFPNLVDMFVKQHMKEQKREENDEDLYNEDEDHFFQTSYFETPVPEKREIKIIISKNERRKERKEKVKSLFEWKEKKEPEVKEFKIINRKINFLIKLLWEEGNELIQQLKGQLELNFCKTDENIYQDGIKHYLIEKNYISKNEEIILTLIQPRKVYYIEGKIYRKKIILPEGYSASPPYFSGFIVDHLAIKNIFGRVMWPSKTNIKGINFLKDFSIDSSSVECNIPNLKKPAIIEFYYLPKEIKNEKNMEKVKKYLEYMSQNKNSKFLSLSEERRSWKIEVDFSK